MIAFKKRQFHIQMYFVLSLILKKICVALFSFCVCVNARSWRSDLNLVLNYLSYLCFVYNRLPRYSA